MLALPTTRATSFPGATVNINTKETARWLAIVAFGGIALYATISLCWGLQPVGSDWFILLFIGASFVTVIAPFYVAAYLCYRRRYRELWRVVGSVAVLIVLFASMNLMTRCDRWLFDYHDKYLGWPWLGWVVVLLVMLCFCFPFWAAYRTARFFDRLANGPPPSMTETGAEENGSGGNPPKLQTPESRSPVA
jgi:hypothetical protein